jgi:hypothetical protein
MKKLYTLLALVITLITFAQAPQGFNYQATVRNSAGVLIVNQNVLVKFNVYQNAANGTIVYSENQSVTTDDLGHINLVVGQGTSNAGTFTNINWGSGSYFLGIELNTGSGYLDMGTTQLMSVPYAFYSSNGTPGPQGPQGLQGIQGIAGPVGATGVQGIPGNDGATGPQGVTGPQGLAGTNGTNGADGLSAYQLWINAGNTGTESQFLASLQGPTGAQGIQGATGATGATGSNGLSAYQLWINAGNTGTESQFLASLQGPTGAQGIQGATGATGSTGSNGLSAYQLWINAGNTGTESQFLASLQGPTGAQGIQGATGATGATGPQGPVGSSAFPIGSVIAYMGNGSIVAGMEANGWFKCDGRNISSLSALSADEITTLTNILGGSSNLPDLRGNFLRGLDEGRGFDDDAASRTGGESTTGVRSQQGESMRNHGHSGTTATDGAHIHNVNTGPWGLILQDGNNTNNGTDLDFTPWEPNIQSDVLKNWQVGSANSEHSHTFTTSDAQNSSTGIIPKAGNENRPDNVAVYWLIRGK